MENNKILHEMAMVERLFGIANGNHIMKQAEIEKIQEVEIVQYKLVIITIPLYHNQNLTRGMSQQKYPTLKSSIPYVLTILFLSFPAMTVRDCIHYKN